MTVKKTPRRFHGLARLIRDFGPYALALLVFVVVAHTTLNPAAARYGDQLFTLALVLIKAGGGSSPPPNAKDPPQ